MEKLAFLALLIAICLSACDQNKVYVPQDLRKLSKEEVIEKAGNYELYDYSIVFRDERGIVLSGDSLYRTLTPSLIFSDFYVNDKNELVEVVLREDVPVDSAMIERIRIAVENGPEVKPVPVDCSDLDNLLNKLERTDQALRRAGKPIDKKQDLENLAIATGIIDYCGMPMSENLNGYTHHGLWLVFQHAPHRYRKQYFHHFVEAAEQNQMPKRHVAMMADRILLAEGKKQLYGSQVRMGINGYELSDLEAPEYVDQRRLAMGMGALRDYLSNYDIKFDIPQKQIDRLPDTQRISPAY